MAPPILPRRSEQDGKLYPELDLVWQLDSATKISRYMSSTHALSLLSHGDSFFCRPSKWPDPWENFIFRNQVILLPFGDVSSTEPFNTDLCKANTFAQCWTKRQGDAAMWAGYTKGDGVEIRTSVGLLHEAVRKHFSNCNVCTGVVKYVDLEKIPETHIAETHSPQAVGFELFNLVVQALLIKVSKFEVESEVRTVIVRQCANDFEGLGEQNDHGFLAQPIDPKSYVEQVVIGPRTDPNIADQVHAACERTGCSVTDSNVDPEDETLDQPPVAQTGHPPPKVTYYIPTTA